MLHKLEGVLESSSILKQGGDQPKKTVVKLIVKSESEPKYKSNLFSEAPNVDNSEDEDIDEDELKKRKAREAKLDEHQRIVRKAEAKEKAEKEAQHIKPQYEMWSSSKITAVKVIGPIKTESFPNAKFKLVKGSTSRVHEFTLADLTCLNPYNWIMFYNLLSRDKQKYEPVIAHLKLMIISYIQEVGKWMWR
ncbi:unnamed protein product [Lactuca saligna]|uniref:Uncharacterized protein n=1 Tax=Lactuca saligna TaxID=75948 RepID=A0AA35Z9Z4_LACSI|nr:unnamed protein product [Lactuca saligna]